METPDHGAEAEASRQGVARLESDGDSAAVGRSVAVAFSGPIPPPGFCESTRVRYLGRPTESFEWRSEAPTVSGEGSNML